MKLQNSPDLILKARRARGAQKMRLNIKKTYTRALAAENTTHAQTASGQTFRRFIAKVAEKVTSKMMMVSLIVVTTMRSIVDSTTNYILSDRFESHLNIFGCLLFGLTAFVFGRGVLVYIYGR